MIILYENKEKIKIYYLSPCFEKIKSPIIDEFSNSQ